MPTTVTQYRAGIPAAPDAEDQEPLWGEVRDDVELSKSDCQFLASTFNVNLLDSYIEMRQVTYEDWSMMPTPWPTPTPAAQAAPEAAPVDPTTLMDHKPNPAADPQSAQPTPDQPTTTEPVVQTVDTPPAV